MIEFQGDVNLIRWTVSFSPVDESLRIRSGDKPWITLELPVAVQRELFADLGRSLSRHGDSISNASAKHG